ncbi:MAG TPA: response regulator [Usitatibacter sp.]|nr:response regulator [Usitatibacter sp.]
MSTNATSKRIGKYEIITLLAKGPRAAVYRAEDPDNKRQVAIKIVPRTLLNADALPEFRKFSLMVMRLEHPAIAPSFEVVENDKAIGIVSELCDGKPLSALLKEGAHPELRNVWDLAKPMLEALGWLHAKLGVHGDVKPSNLILAPDGRLKVTDFGHATLLSSPPVEINYRAPEQFEGDPSTARTDVYQAGAILYQLVTGKTPFGGTPAEIEHRIMQERPSDPSSIDNRIAWQLDWVIQKALSKDPIDRFGNAIEFADGLRLGLSDTAARPLAPVAPPGTKLVQNVTPIAKKAAPPAAAPAPGKAVPGELVDIVDSEDEPAPPKAPAPAPVAAAPASEQPAPADRVLDVPSAPEAPATYGPPKHGFQPARTQQMKAQPQLAKPAPAPAAEKPAVTPAPEKPAAAPAPQKPAAPPKPRIVFVDDDERILNGVRALFRQEYEVLVARSGEDAIAHLRAGGVHVIVSDQRMPNMTGVELLRQARDVSPNTVRMLLTGYSDLAALVGSINDGEIYRFVKKPWDNDDLRRDVADAMKVAIDKVGAVPVVASSPRTAGSLLVIDPKEGLGRGLERLLAGEAEVVQVTGPADAAKEFGKREIAAVVADLGAGMDGLVALFKQIKAKRPGVLTILLADEPDAELGIELVNKAHVFRFMPKPVSGKDLRHEVAEALRRYAAWKISAPAKGSADGGAQGDAVARSA